VQPGATVTSSGDTSFQQPADSQADDRSPASPRTQLVDTSAPDDTPAAVADRLYAEVANTAAAAPTVAAPAVPAPVRGQADDVAAQIAQQVDLYRLPGSKGVRIQLHPEDLGGVQVTMRYAAGGNLELHISTEHASTAHLVEAGWSQLRDALATQGFQPERLVMSVSAPAAANQMDFSSNSDTGSFRSDPGMAAFTQDGDSRQERSRPDEGRTWTMGSAPAGDEAIRPSVSTAASVSRIDYRV
jgi:flagellar hook-length control protein FliK